MKNEKKEMMPFIPASDTMPAHLKESTGLGNENVGQDDLAIPRLNVLQQLSPQLDEGKAEYLEAAKAGMLHNSVTNDLYSSVYVINLYFEKNYAVFKKRKFGKGFYGTFDTREAALSYLKDNELDESQMDIPETGNHYCLLLDDKGNISSPIVISMSSTKLRVSSKWNSDIRLQNTDRFAGVWEVSTVRQSNDKGTWSNLVVKAAGWANEDLYKQAKDNYEGLASSKQQAA